MQYIIHRIRCYTTCITHDAEGYAISNILMCVALIFERIIGCLHWDLFK